ncbi:hypothetical protein ACOZ9X_01205 [Fictibacillus nanhaiensis]
MWLDKNVEYTNDFLEWCKTYWLEENKRMPGTYGEQLHQITISNSPVLKLNSSQPLDKLYAEVIEKRELLSYQLNGVSLVNRYSKLKILGKCVLLIIVAS